MERGLLRTDEQKRFPLQWDIPDLSHQVTSDRMHLMNCSATDKRLQSSDVGVVDISLLNADEHDCHGHARPHPFSRRACVTLCEQLRSLEIDDVELCSRLLSEFAPPILYAGSGASGDPGLVEYHCGSGATTEMRCRLVSSLV
jgi:hypothetical protein